MVLSGGTAPYDSQQPPPGVAAVRPLWASPAWPGTLVAPTALATAALLSLSARPGRDSTADHARHDRRKQNSGAR